jgi:hypothetical protein
MSGTVEGGKKAAETRGHESLADAGRKGAEARSHESRVEGGKKAMETRAENEGKSVHDVAAEMGREGGAQSHGGKTTDKDDE